LYNGKELDTDFGLDWYHYGARMYDPAIGRFTGVDPISDAFPHVSTYNYAENRPVNGIDLHGLQFVPFHITQDNVQHAGDIGDAYRQAGKLGGQFLEGTARGIFALPNALSNDHAAQNARNLGNEQRANELGTAASQDYAEAALEGMAGGFFGKVFGALKGITKGSLDNVAGLDILDNAGLAAIKGGSRFRKGKVNDFDLIHTKNEFEKSDLFKDLTQMSDDDLIKTLNDFSDKWPAIEVKRGKIYRGNNRIYEARRRGINPDMNYREIRDDTFDYFPDLDPNWKPGND